jgi:hypothetical protein
MRLIRHEPFREIQGMPYHMNQIKYCLASCCID